MITDPSLLTFLPTAITVQAIDEDVLSNKDVVISVNRKFFFMVNSFSEY
jgi:hypothetical protein